METIKEKKDYDILTPGSIIRAEIKKRGLSQKQLAEELNISKSHMSGIIYGKRAITITIAQKLHEKKLSFIQDELKITSCQELKTCSGKQLIDLTL